MSKTRQATESNIKTINGQSLIRTAPNEDLIIADTHAAIAAADIDVSSAEHFTKTITANTNFTVSNVPAAPIVPCFVVTLVNGGAYTVNWWANIKWKSGTKPALTVSGEDDLIFRTVDGGATWSGYLIGPDMRVSV